MLTFHLVNGHVEFGHIGYIARIESLDRTCPSVCRVILVSEKGQLAVCPVRDNEAVLGRIYIDR
jgi:hypothetical protein